ncbi:MAG: hypothetical protein ACHREM_06735 [Polyangiales bacterium]
MSKRPAHSVRLHATIGLFFSLASAVACGGIVSAPAGQSGDAGMDASALPVPSQHRPVPVACPSTRPTGTIPSGFAGDCASDADCTSGRNGRCLLSLPYPPLCSYDDCTVDDDCGLHSVCACRTGGYRANLCTIGGCRVDGDCGSHGYCSPSPAACPPQDGIVGYYCHHPGDVCVNDADCAAAFGGNTAMCAFDPNVGHWMCLEYSCRL